MTRIPRAQLQTDSGRKHADAVESWLRSRGWDGMLDADNWPIVYADWYYGTRAAPSAGYEVNIGALTKKAA